MEKHCSLGNVKKKSNGRGISPACDSHIRNAGVSKITTKELEHKIYFALAKMGTYLCFEVMMPSQYRGANSNERVDLLTYDTKGIWRFYEIKISKSDFYSKCKHTFLGHYNYFVMPLELYDQVKQDIPDHIGCYVSCKGSLCYCIKKPKKQNLKIDEDKLKFSFMQSLSRDVRKYRLSLREKV